MINNFQETVKNKSNDELLKIVYQFDQWSPEMLEAVEHELARRNILPTDISIRKQQSAEIEEEQLTKGKEPGLIGQIIGWLGVFGFLGIFIGYHYAFSKVRSKYTDTQYFRYNETARKNGSYLFYISMCLSVIAIFYKIMTAY